MDSHSDGDRDRRKKRQGWRQVRGRGVDRLKNRGRAKSRARGQIRGHGQGLVVSHLRGSKMHPGLAPLPLLLAHIDHAWEGRLGVLRGRPDNGHVVRRAEPVLVRDFIDSFVHAR